MKRILLVAAVALAAFPSLKAQENANVATTTANTDIIETIEYAKGPQVQTNKFWSNWFITLAGGVNTYFGDHNKKLDFTDRLAPNAEIGIGKWFSPEIGVRLMYSGLSFKGATQNGAHSTGKWKSDEGWLYEQEFDFFHLHGDVMFNMSNILCGYNETRIWNVIPYLSCGWGRVWEAPQAKAVIGSLGLVNKFRISKAFDLHVDVRASLVSNDKFDGESGGYQTEGFMSASAGVTYNFPKRGWDRAKTITRIDNSAINALNTQLAALGKENEALKKALELCEKEPKKVIESDLVVAPMLLTFQLNKHELSKKDRVNLGFLAEMIKNSAKQGKKHTYVITGYADKGTGSTNRNQELSELRAKAVYQCLTQEYNVPTDMLQVEAQGGVENMFYDDPRLSRAVITKVQE